MTFAYLAAALIILLASSVGLIVVRPRSMADQDARRSVDRIVGGGGLAAPVRGHGQHGPPRRRLAGGPSRRVLRMRLARLDGTPSRPPE